MLTGFLQNNCSKQRLRKQKLPGRCPRVLEKDFTIDVFFIRKFERQKQKLRKKNFFFAMPMLMPTSMAMLMPRCQCRDFQMANKISWLLYKTKSLTLDFKYDSFIFYLGLAFMIFVLVSNEVLPSLFILTWKHFCKRQYLHWFRCILSTGQGRTYECALLRCCFCLHVYFLWRRKKELKITLFKQEWVIHEFIDNSAKIKEKNMVPLL